MTVTLERIACPLCGADRERTVLDGLRDRTTGLDGEFRIVDCVACGHRYLNPRPTPESIGLFYPDEYLPHSAGGGLLRDLFRRRALAGARRIAARIPPGGTVLEIGCGSGRLLDGLAGLGLEVVGQELSPSAAAVAQEKGHRVFVGPAEEHDVAPGSADAVVMSHVIEHLHDPVRVLRAAARALRPGGRLLVSTPEGDPWAARLFRRAFAWDVPRHLHFFPVDRLRTLLGEVGLEVEEERWDRLPIQWVRSGLALLPESAAASRLAAGPVAAAAALLGLPVEALAAARRGGTRFALWARRP